MHRNSASTLTSRQMFSNRVIQRHLTRENGTVSFYAMSDVPYTIHEMANIPLQIASLDEDDADFAIHLDGIQPQADHCTQQAYQDMRLILEMSALPMFILPGAHDYYNCWNREPAWNLWQRNLGNLHNNWDVPFTTRTQTLRPENFAFTFKSTLFIGLHIVRLTSVQNSMEWKTFERQNQNWLVKQVALFQDKMNAVVLFSHAYPNQKDYPNLWEEFNDVAEFLPNIPFLWLQGDALQWVDDEPFRAKNVRRVVADSGGHADPVLVTIDPETTDGRPFFFERRPLSQL